ncbi:MAG: F0F1 ATP synthase subunit epsilon [Candidatus Omnitrophota bacterium]|nr:F0F1 ATP synthase subunit epsilon [Candidatus Omnitrophota bacterium]
MANPIRLRVLTEAGVAVEEGAVSIIAPGEVGYLGILSHHAPLVTTLRPGTLSWKRPTGERRALLIGTGLLEIARNRFTVLTSTIAEPSPTATPAI